MLRGKEETARHYSGTSDGIGLKPLNEVNGFKIRPGFYRMLGAYQTADGVSFTVNSHGATSCTLVLFRPEEREPYAEIEIPEAYRIGDYYSVLVYGLKIEKFEYAYRFDGEYNPEKGLLFNKENIILPRLLPASGNGAKNHTGKQDLSTMPGRSKAILTGTVSSSWRHLWRIWLSMRHMFAALPRMNLPE